MPTFQLRNRPGSAVPAYTGQLYHGAYSWSPLKIMGHISSSGPQRVDNDEQQGGVPPEVHALFERFPEVQQIALVTPEPENAEPGFRTPGLNVVYSRLKPDEPQKPDQG